MKVLVTGSRHWNNRELLYGTLDGLDPPATFLGHGGARGADTMAGEWALERGLPCQVFPADWETHGRAAGPIRNQQMLTEFGPEMVVAFKENFQEAMLHGGTEHMVRIALRAGIEVCLVGSTA